MQDNISVQTRNRRLQKMKNLMKEGEYFSMVRHILYRDTSFKIKVRYEEEVLPSFDWCVLTQESMEGRAPLLYYENIGRFEEKDGFDGPQDENDCSGRRNTPPCQNLGSWRENSGVGQALADFLLHGIDRQEIRSRREQELEARNACGILIHV